MLGYKVIFKRILDPDNTCQGDLQATTYIDGGDTPSHKNKIIETNAEINWPTFLPELLGKEQGYKAKIDLNIFRQEQIWLLGFKIQEQILC